jgi:ATP-dependent DNA helicase RecQ
VRATPVTRVRPDPALLEAAYVRRGTRERAAMLRALLEMGEPDLAASLAASAPTDSLAILDVHAEALLQADRAPEALPVVAAREARGASSVSLGLRVRALAAVHGAEAALAALEGAQLDAYLHRTIEGEAFLAAGDAARSRAAFEAALALHPYRRRALAGLVRACLLGGDLVHGSAYAARLLDTQEGEEVGDLSARYLKGLRDLYAAAGEDNRVREVDALLGERRAEAEARLAALVEGEPVAPARAPARTPASVAAPPVAPAPAPQPVPVAEAEASATPEERARVAGLLQRYLGFAQPRPGQVEVMARVLRGEDVLAVMPTGGGKSVCYQLPAVLEPGVTLVVSPLIALMKDQLDGLPPPMRAAAVSITSELTPAEARGVLAEVTQGRYRLVYVAPERLRSAPLLRALRQAGVKRLVVDEAHCVSVWGHDFRPDYLHIAEARRALGDPPVLAMTATAPPRVLHDIMTRLSPRGGPASPLALVRASIARPNLRFEAVLCKQSDDKLAHLYTLCREAEKPGIVYASSRAKCEQLAEALRGAGLNAAAYHAGRDDRALQQEDFMENRTDILVATVAFGMGVDKGDIRFVFHHDPASSIENYYQEAGRAGRDGKPARCVLLATAQDGGTLKQRARQDLPSRDLVSHVWSGVLARADEATRLALVPLEDLQDLAQERDDVKPRVALSILTEAGVVERLADVPLRFRVRDAKDPALSGAAAGDATVFDLAPALGVAPESVEAELLEREARGELRHQSTGRGQLLRVLGDTSRVEGVLERYAALAEQRAKEIMDYVKTRRCRHAYLRAYFGEEAPERCGECDVCLGIEHVAGEIPGADDETAARSVLMALGSVRGMGQVNLVLMLRGDARAPEWTVGKPGFGALAFRSEARVRGVIEEVERLGLVQRETLPHGGVTLQLTQLGAGALHADAPVIPARAARSPAPAAPRARPADPRPAPARAPDHASGAAAPPPDEEPLDEAAQARFERLRAWRRDAADADGVPPYVVAHDKTLRAIARADPRTPDDLLVVKGMGPKRVEKHGADILRVLGDG